MTRLILLAALPLAACVPAPEAAAPATALPADPIAAAEQGCLDAVARAAGTTQVVTINGDFSEAGTTYRIGAGPQNLPWTCIGYADGSTAGVAPA
jgi:hypothetical protein